MNSATLNTWARGGALALMVLTSGCASRIHVTKATDDSPGIRYYLPQVFIQITPNPDGSFKVEPIYLPDPANEYTIKADSYLGKYTLDVNRTEKGFLDVVSFNSDNTGIAKQLISSQAALRATEIETQAAKAKTEAAEAKAAADKQAAAVAAAEKAQKDALLALQVAQARLALLESQVGKPGVPDDLNKQILAARVAVAEATVKYNDSIVVTNTAAANFAAANGSGTSTTALKAPGPVFLKVAMTKDSVQLVRSFEQENWATWKIPSPVTQTAELAMFPGNQVARPDPKTGALTVDVKSNRPLQSFGLKSLRQLSPDPKDLDPAQLVVGLQIDRLTVRIDFPKGMAAGNYRIRADADTGSPGKPESKEQIVEVRIER